MRLQVVYADEGDAGKPEETRRIQRSDETLNETFLDQIEIALHGRCLNLLTVGPVRHLPLHWRSIVARPYRSGRMRISTPAVVMVVHDIAPGQ